MSPSSLQSFSLLEVLLIRHQRNGTRNARSRTRLGVDAGFPIWPTVPYGHFGSGSTEGEQNALR
jgi:hypothetical protein